MKILLLFAALAFVAVAKGNEANTTKEIYRRVWADDGERIVTFGYSRCQKSMRSRMHINRYILASRTCRDINFVFADCPKAAQGTCHGLYSSYLDYLSPEQRTNLRGLRYPRTFYFRKNGNMAVVSPITPFGRLLESDYLNQQFFDEWCENARRQTPHDWLKAQNAV